MVLELKVPHGVEFAALKPLLPVFLSYVLSFIYVGIYWNNHHHLLHAAQHVSAGIMWANLHLLFWLSLVPFATGWMGENHFGALPTALSRCRAAPVAAVAYTLAKDDRRRATIATPRWPRAWQRLERKDLTHLLLTAIALAFVNRAERRAVCARRGDVDSPTAASSARW